MAKCWMRRIRIELISLEFGSMIVLGDNKGTCRLIDVDSSGGISIGDIVKCNNNEKEIEVVTGDGSVTCKHVVLASHYPIINYPGFYFLKM